MTLHAWNGYKKYAWGKNELRPLSKQPNQVEFLGYTNQDMGLTIVDSLDTLLIMNLTQQFEEAAEWVRQNFTIDVDSEMSVFEVNIRYVGGFLSAYTLTSDQVNYKLESKLSEKSIIYPFYLFVGKNSFF